MLEPGHVLIFAAISQILAAVRFRVLASPFSTDPESADQLPPLYAGQPIPALLSIQTSFHWGTRQDTNRKSYRMRFDIAEMVQDWLISGRKRGDFVAEVCLYPGSQLIRGRIM
jgi:hypothetical protein